MCFLPVLKTTFTRPPTISMGQFGFRMVSEQNTQTFVQMSYQLTRKLLDRWMTSRNLKDSSRAKWFSKNFRTKALILIRKTANTRKKQSSTLRTVTVTSTQNMELMLGQQLIAQTTWTTEAVGLKSLSCKTSTTQQTTHFQRASVGEIISSMGWTQWKQFQMCTMYWTKFDLFIEKLYFLSFYNLSDEKNCNKQMVSIDSFLCSLVEQ